MGILDNVDEYKAVEKMIKEAVQESSNTVTTALKDLKTDLECNFVKAHVLDKKLLVVGVFVGIAVILSGYAAGIKTVDTVFRWLLTRA